MFYLYILKNGEKGLLDTDSTEKWREVIERSKEWPNPISVSYLYSKSGAMVGKSVGEKLLVFGGSI